MLKAASPLWLACVLFMPVMGHGEERLAVAAVVAERTDTKQHHVLIGEITAPDSLQAAFPVGGRISEMLVDVGDAVAKGAVLARIEQVQQVQALRSAEAQLSAAAAEFRAAQDEATRQDGLFERGATTRSARDAAADRYAAAVARKAQAEAALDQARVALDDTTLSAPDDATVIRRRAEPGQVVGAAQPVLDLALGAGFEAVFDVPETVLTAARDADPVIRLSPLEHAEAVVTGHVREVSPLVDPARGTVEVTVVLNAPIPGLTYGDAVRGATTWVEGGQIALPWSAISSTAEGSTVWIVSPETGAVSERRITVSRYTEGTVLIDDGVAPGEVVVTRGTQLLYPGRMVRVVEEAQ